MLQTWEEHGFLLLFTRFTFYRLASMSRFFVAIYETRMEVYNYIAVHGLFVLLQLYVISKQYMFRHDM